MVYVLNKKLKDYKPWSPAGQDTVIEIVAQTPEEKEVTIHLQNTDHPDGVYSILANSVYGIQCERVVALRDTFKNGAQSEIISSGRFPCLKFLNVRVKETPEEIVAAFKEASIPAPTIVSQRSAHSLLHTIYDIARLARNAMGAPLFT